MENQEYEKESDCEDYADYGPEGYHPVVLGQKFNGDYIVIQKLGWGHFSTVWLVKKQSTNEYLALKIQRSKESHGESALDELQMLKQVRKHEEDEVWVNYIKSLQNEHPTLLNAKLCSPLRLLDNFTHHGIHGKHYCSVFELMGPNLLDVIQHFQFKDKRMPLWLVKKITRDTLIGLVYLHQHCKIIHTDLKPQNIMIKLEDYQEKQLISHIKAYKIKPLSMKYLKNLHTSKNSKNKKKNQKKKLKKKKEKELAQGQNQQNDEEEEDIKIIQSESSNINESSISQPSKVESNISQSSNAQEVKSKIASNEQKGFSKQQMEAQSSQQKSNEAGMIKEQEFDENTLSWKNVKIKMNNKIFFKIADMGNACFTTKHFSDDIQTREYRSPEVLLGHGYSENTDIWSLGCVVYEMMTNNFLFKPKKISGIDKNQDHLFKMIETLGPMEKEFMLSGKESQRFFTKKGKLLNGNPKQTIPIYNLLLEDYDYSQQDALAAQEFLTPLLAYDPKDRINARDCLKAEWLWS